MEHEEGTVFNGGCAACNKYDGVRHESVGKRNRKNNGDGGKHRDGRDNGEADKYRSTAGGGGDAGKNQGCAG